MLFLSFLLFVFYNNKQSGRVMKSAKLFSTLNSLSVIGEKFKHINRGGCGAFALYLSKELDKRNIKHDILWIGDDYHNAEKVIRNTFQSNSNVTLEDFSDNGIFLSHVMVRIGKKFIDSEGVYKGFDNTRWSHRRVLSKVSNKELFKLVDNPKGWNDTFNRKLMPKIKKDIKKIMEKAD